MTRRSSGGQTIGPRTPLRVERLPGRWRLYVADVLELELEDSGDLLEVVRDARGRRRRKRVEPHVRHERKSRDRARRIVSERCEEMRRALLARTRPDPRPFFKD